MKLVTYNIQYGLGRDGRYDLPRIVSVLAGADVIALQEVERFWVRSGMIDEVEEIAKLLPDYHWVYGPGVDLDASYRDANGRLVNRRRQFGNMLLSRNPIISSRNHLLPKYGALTRTSLQRSALETVIQARFGAVRIYSIHLTYLASELRLAQIEAILELHRRAPADGGVFSEGSLDVRDRAKRYVVPMPREAILMGDFNFTPSAPEYALLVGPFSPEYGRLNNIDGFLDAWVAAGHPEDSGVTRNPKGRLDYCFVSAGLADRVQSASIDMEAEGSDHQPVWIEMEL